MSILSNLLFYLVGMWLQKLILISQANKTLIPQHDCKLNLLST